MDSLITNTKTICEINNILIAGTIDGIVYSEDYGNTWSQSDFKLGMIDFLYNSGETLIAGSSIGNLGIWRSTDYGKTWIQNQIINGGNFNCKITINERVYIGGESGLYYSTDDCVSWIKNEIQADVRCIFYMNDIVIVGSKTAGIFRSIDLGITWTNISDKGKSCSLVYGINNTFVINIDSKMLYSEDGGQEWQESNNIINLFSSIIKFNNILIMGSNDDSGIWYSIDGCTWNMTDLISGSFSDIFVIEDTIIASSSSNGGIVYSKTGLEWLQSNVDDGNFCEIVPLTYDDISDLDIIDNGNSDLPSDIVVDDNLSDTIDDITEDIISYKTDDNENDFITIGDNKILFNNNVKDVVYLNGFVHAFDKITHQLYKITPDFNIVNKIYIEDGKTMFTIGDSILIEKNDGSYVTEIETAKRHPNIFKTNSVINSKIVSSI